MFGNTTAHSKARNIAVLSEIISFLPKPADLKPDKIKEKQKENISGTLHILLESSIKRSLTVFLSN